MIRKTLTILSVIGLLLSVGAWGVSYFNLVYVPQTLIHRVWLYGGQDAAAGSDSPHGTNRGWLCPGMGRSALALRYRG